ncbi:EamA family transporter [Streptomyces sp. P1-3]|uniref:EamA family transporter n=1 Tax=Streptomyces sp. P1-3 TaxID=3421658 RepID=UPI003D36EE6A
MRPAHLLLAVLIAAVWGVNFVVIEVGLDHFPPLFFCALRFLAAALPAVFFVGRPQVPWRWIIGVGLALGVAKFGLLFIAMNQGLHAGLSSLVLQIQAVFTAVFAAVVLGERPGPVRLLGMAVALTGIAVAAVDEGTSGPVVGFVLAIAAAAGWGVSNILMRRAAPPDAPRFMVWVSVVPVLPLLGLSLVFEGPAADRAALASLDWGGVGTILYVAWGATVLGFGAWSFLLRTYDASAVAPFSLLVPVFGMSSAALLLGEEVSPLRWVAAALLVGGVALTSLPGISLPGLRPAADRPSGVRRRPRAAASDAAAPVPTALAAAPPADTSASRTPSTATPPTRTG